MYHPRIQSTLCTERKKKYFSCLEKRWNFRLIQLAKESWVCHTKSTAKTRKRMQDTTKRDRTIYEIFPLHFRFCLHFIALVVLSLATQPISFRWKREKKKIFSVSAVVLCFPFFHFSCRYTLFVWIWVSMHFIEQWNFVRQWWRERHSTMAFTDTILNRPWKYF